jgi:hypothetical protein
MCSANRDIRFGPKADIAITRSVIGKRQEFVRYDESKCLGGFKIDHQLELGWLLEGRSADVRFGS